MKNLVLGLCLGLAGLVSGARAQIGSPPPEFTPVRWMNSAPLTLEELRGKAVLLVVFRTWNEQCASDVPALSARYDKELKNGLYVIGVSSEPPEALAPWIRMYTPTYPVLALKGEEFERALGAQGTYYPIHAVVDPEGTLTYSSGLLRGSFDTALGEALAKASKGSIWPKKLDRVVDAIRARQNERAWAELAKLRSGTLGEAETKAADKLAAYVEAAARDTLDECRKLLEDGRVYEAHERLTGCAKANPPYAITPDARQLLGELEALDGYKDEMKVGPAFVEAYENELRQEFKKAVDTYRELQKKHAKLRIAAAIQARIDGLAAIGMLIYIKDCEDCIAAKRACKRHAEP